MNLLYFGTPNSIHDFKWSTYFSAKPEIKVFFITDAYTYRGLEKKDFESYNERGIEILPPFQDFSLLKPFRTLKSIYRFNRLIKHKNISVLHALFGVPYPVWFNFLRCENKVITTRGSDVLVMLKELRETQFYKIHLKFLLKLIERSFFKSNFVTCTSQLQIEELKNIGLKANQLNLVKTGVDVGKINSISIKEHLPGDLKGLKIIFSPRFMRPVYNFEFQIEAYHLLPKEVLENYTFVFIRGIIVSDDYYNKLITLLDEVKGLKYVVFKSLKQEQIWAITKQASLSLMVPKSDGTPNTALEAMSCKTPLIMGDLNYNQELFGGVALIANLNSVKDLADKIQTALTNYPQAFLERGLHNVSKFGNRSIEMEKLNSLYKML